MGGQLLGAVDGAVRDGHVLDAEAAQVGGREGGHRTCTDDDGAASAQRVAAGLRDPEHGQGLVEGEADHRGAGGVDLRLAVDALASAQGSLGEVVEGAPDGAGLLRLLVSAAELADDLLFPQHHGVQAGGHVEHVLHRGVGVVNVEVRFQVAVGEPGVGSDGVHDVVKAGVEGIGHRVELHPVAGGQHQRLGEGVVIEQGVFQLGKVGVDRGDLLEDGHRSGSEGKPDEQHSGGTGLDVPSHRSCVPPREPGVLPGSWGRRRWAECSPMVGVMHRSRRGR